MRAFNRNIGFDDRLVMLITIPVLSFIVPIVFMGCRFNRAPFFGWDKFLTTLVIITILWLGDRKIMIYCRSKYNDFTKVRERFWMQSLLMIGFTLVVNNGITFLAHDYIFKPSAGLLFSDLVINCNAASLFCTVTIIAIYESIYFKNELRLSITEKEQLKRENLSAQLNALRTQVNPHFLFNNLNTLCSIIPDEPATAVAFVQQMAKVYRHILEVKDEKSIPLKDELDVLKSYIFLLKTRFGNNLEVDIQVPKEKLQNRVVPLSLQLLLENAIKHNIVSTEKPLHIGISSINGTLIVSNTLQKKNQVLESTGIGLDNIRNRYRLLGDRPVEVLENTTVFSVTIPLIKT
jgi:two-component system, LytTR family, sensor kinase